MTTDLQVIDFKKEKIREALREASERLHQLLAHAAAGELEQAKDIADHINQAVKTAVALYKEMVVESNLPAETLFSTTTH